MKNENKAKAQIGRPRIKRPSVSDIFPKILSMVEFGDTISNALNKLGINRSEFYRGITIQQKKELLVVKTLNAKYSVYGRGVKKTNPNSL